MSLDFLNASKIGNMSCPANKLLMNMFVAENRSPSDLEGTIAVYSSQPHFSDVYQLDRTNHETYFILLYREAGEDFVCSFSVLQCAL